MASADQAEPRVSKGVSRWERRHPVCNEREARKPARNKGVIRWERTKQRRVVRRSKPRLIAGRMPALPAADTRSPLSAARAFLIDAEPFKDQFIAHELPADFLEDLRADIAALEAAMSEQESGVGQRLVAGVSIDETIDNGAAIVRKLDAIMQNKYFNNRAVLAEWTRASHTERDPRHKSTKAPATPTPGSPTGGPPPTGGGSSTA